MKYIESVQNKKIKELTKLHTKKERDKQALFLVEGIHMVKEAKASRILKDIYILEGKENPTDMEATYCTQVVMNKLSVQNSDANWIGVCQKPVFKNHEEHKILLLQDVQDPGNVGTLIRTAYSFGFDAIYMSKSCADPFNAKTLQSSQGAVFHLPIYNCDILDTIEDKKQSIQIFATALHHDSIALQDASPIGDFGIVMGNEGQGLSNEVIEACSQCIKIEMDRFESLNVAIAGAICMYSLKMKSAS